MRSLARALQPFAGERTEAIEIEGAPVRLDARQSLSVSLVLHELATNAAKYGALSIPEGSVEIAWAVQDETQAPRLVMDWTEHGGPPVAQPERRGFGRFLIERSLAYELSGSAELTFSPAGVRCHIEVPLGGPLP